MLLLLWRFYIVKKGVKRILEIKVCLIIPTILQVLLSKLFLSSNYCNWRLPTSIVQFTKAIIVKRVILVFRIDELLIGFIIMNWCIHVKIMINKVTTILLLIFILFNIMIIWNLIQTSELLLNFPVIKEPIYNLSVEIMLLCFILIIVLVIKSNWCFMEWIFLILSWNDMRRSKYFFELVTSKSILELGLILQLLIVMNNCIIWLNSLMVLWLAWYIASGNLIFIERWIQAWNFMVSWYFDYLWFYCRKLIFVFLIRYFSYRNLIILWYYDALIISFRSKRKILFHYSTTN